MSFHIGRECRQVQHSVGGFLSDLPRLDYSSAGYGPLLGLKFRPSSGKKNQPSRAKSLTHLINVMIRHCLK